MIDRELWRHYQFEFFCDRCGNGFASEFDTIEFDEDMYTLELRSGMECLILTKLAKWTNEFIDRLRSAIDDLSDDSARILQTIFPFLSPDQFHLIAGLMREGRAIAISKLAAIHPKIIPVKKTVDSDFKPYFDNLRKRVTIEDDFFAGFKIIRPEGEKGAVDGGSDKSSKTGLVDRQRKSLRKEPLQNQNLMPKKKRMSRNRCSIGSYSIFQQNQGKNACQCCSMGVYLTFRTGHLLLPYASRRWRRGYGGFCEDWLNDRIDDLAAQ